MAFSPLVSSLVRSFAVARTCFEKRANARTAAFPRKTDRFRDGRGALSLPVETGSMGGEFSRQIEQRRPYARCPERAFMI
jgi:hypothetical protein